MPTTRQSADSVSSAQTTGAQSVGDSAALSAGTAAPVPGRLRFLVHFDPMRLSTNKTRRMNRYALYELTKVARTATRYAWIEAGCPRMTGRAQLTLIVRRGVRLDDDSVITGAKWLRDELCECLGYPSDREITQGPVIYDCRHRWKDTNAHVEVWVDPVTELDDGLFLTSRAHRESQLVGITNHLLAACDALLSEMGAGVPAYFRAAVLRAHADLARFVGAGGGG